MALTFNSFYFIWYNPTECILISDLIIHHLLKYFITIFYSYIIVPTLLILDSQDPLLRILIINI